MTDKMPCELIRDLLPTYQDRLTSPVTNALVEEHLADCPDCRQVLQRMQSPLEPETDSAAEGSKASTVDFLKRVRVMGRWKLAAVCVATIFVCLLVVNLFQKQIGHDVTGAVQQLEITVEGEHITVDGTLEGENLNVTRAEINPLSVSVNGSNAPGYYSITVYGAELYGKDASDKADGHFHIELDAAAEVKQIYLQGGYGVVWSGGTMIAAQTRIFSETMEAIPESDDRAEDAAADCFGISETAGAFTESWSDAKHADTLTIQMKELVGEDEEEQLNDLMERYAYALMSASKDLESVELRYGCRSGGEKTTTFSRSDAAQELGADFCAQGKGIAAQERVLEALELVDPTAQ